VTFGLMTFINGSAKYVMPRQGGGAKKETIRKDATYDDMLRIAKELYNMDEDSDCYLGTYDAQQLDKNITCSQFVKQSNFVTLPRIYLIKQESFHSRFVKF
jgi:dsDNA-binding SOS-regulon protein